MRKYGVIELRVPSNKVKGQVDEVKVDVYIDDGLLRRLADRAGMSRGGRAVIGGGAVIAKVKSRAKVA